ncbi:hypothetical protein RIR_jg38831.t1 [Rhizophagus irregularis DAOM 181602=DAOM 197198]|nr:hypothetical protein RIR_jg38831.t1 [Rhizophagus irregularis DAOM 181602=DAOM 197198]
MNRQSWRTRETWTDERPGFKRIKERLGNLDEQTTKDVTTSRHRTLGMDLALRRRQHFGVEMDELDFVLMRTTNLHTIGFR